MTSRREFLKIAFAGVAGLVVGGAAGWSLRGPGISPEKIAEYEKEIERLRKQLQERGVVTTVTETRTVSGAPKHEEALHVYNWSYYIQEALLDIFSQETGIPRDKLVYDVFEDPAEPFAKLEAGRSGYDIIVLPDYDAGLAIKRGYVRKLDKSLIPNMKFMDPNLLNPPFDPGNIFSLVYMWGTTGYSWRSDLAPEGVTTVKQIFDPDYGFLKKYKKKITMLSEAEEVVLSAKAYLGKDPYDWSDATMEEVKEVLIKQKPYLAAYAGTSEYFQGLASGSIYVAQAYNGDIAVFKGEEHPELADKISYGIPQEGGTRWTDNLLIPNDAPHPIAAHLFINFLLDPAVAAVNSNYIKYANSVKASQPLMEEGILKDPVIYPPEDVQKKLWRLPILTDEEKAKMNKIWEEVQAA